MLELLAPVGIHLALFLPFVVLSTVSPDAVRESKGVVLALAAALTLAGLALEAWSGRRPGALRPPRTVAVVLGGVALLVAASTVRGLLSWTDPLVAVPVGAAAALFLAGASRIGQSVRERAFAVLAFAGAFTGLLAFLQRTAGLFRIAEVSPDPRYQAVALLGNPGDVGAALVLPAVILAAGLMDRARSRRSHLLHLAGLALVLLGLAAAEALTPLAAVVAGVVALSLFDLRSRGVVLTGLAVAGLLALVAAGATGRFGKIASRLEKGAVSEVLTERDIGFRASLEMIRARPFLGEGPGGFSNAFVPARIRADERAGRRLVHSSPSSHFENAHNEWLTFAAECGLPAALLGTAGAGLLLVHLARKRADLLFALVLSFAVLGLASFPSRLAVVAGPAALVAGLALRAISGQEPVAPPRRSGRGLAALLGAAATLLALLAAARGRAVLRQADGEAALRAAVEGSPADRPYLLDLSRAALKESLVLRSRFAPTWLALGSVYRFERDLESAQAALSRSLELEERAETDLNLGRVAWLRGDHDGAMALFTRAVWVLPRLRASLPPEVDLPALDQELRAIEIGLSKGGSAPPLRFPRRGEPSRPSGSG